MKQIVIIQLFFISIFSMGQSFFYSSATMKSYNSNNQKHGLWVFYYANRLNVFANFSNDSLVDILYRPASSKENDNDYIYKQYKEGRLWNVLYKYDCFEQSQDIGTFHNGFGMLKSYIPFKDTGCNVLYSEVSYINGEPNGHAIYYYSDGKRKRLEGSLTPYNGEQICYSKLYLTEYKNDTVVSYYFNSTKEIRDGWWKYYSYDGQLTLEILYNYGEIVSILDYMKPGKERNNGLTKYYKRKGKAKCVTEKEKFSYYSDRLYRF